MIIDLKRSVDLRWLFVRVLLFILRWFRSELMSWCHHQGNESKQTNWVKSSIALSKTDPGEAKRTKPDGPVSWTHPYCVRSPQWPPPSTQAPSSFSWSHSLPRGFHLRADKPHKYWYLWNMCPQVFLVLWLFCQTLFSILFPSPLLKGICSVGSSYK